MIADGDYIHSNSPVSVTTTVPEALSCSKEEVDIIGGRKYEEDGVVKYKMKDESNKKKGEE